MSCSLPQNLSKLRRKKLELHRSRFRYSVVMQYWIGMAPPQQSLDSRSCFPKAFRAPAPKFNAHGVFMFQENGIVHVRIFLSRCYKCINKNDRKDDGAPPECCVTVSCGGVQGVVPGFCTWKANCFGEFTPFVFFSFYDVSIADMNH